MRPNTRTCFLEKPDQPDARRAWIFRPIAETAHQGGARLIVDNVFGRP